MQGSAFVFGDEINTDLIAPAIANHDGELVDVLFQPIRPNFAGEVDAGDIIVAGNHFGSGSSRETAPQAILDAGISAVVANSFSRIYYRNSVAIGLPAIVCHGAASIVSEGDVVEIDLVDGKFNNHTTSESLDFVPIPQEIRSIFEAGGLMKHYESHPDGLRFD